MQVKVKLVVLTPNVPNFLLCASGEKIPLSAVSDEGLGQIADEWRKDFFKRAAEQTKADKKT